jgi:hypothetical protein
VNGNVHVLNFAFYHRSENQQLGNWDSKQNQHRPLVAENVEKFLSYE